MHINFSGIRPVRTALANTRVHQLKDVNLLRRHPIMVDLMGNEAIGYAAIDAGRERGLFFGGYPITPSSETMQTIVANIDHLPKGKFFQAEDEIASIGSIIGAASIGRRVMTATSGPGFSLMQENLGLAALNGIPIVVVNVQRSGPSTGAPTKGSQADVQQSRWGTHGDHPIIVLAPSSAQECYDLTIDAFNIADEFLTPVVILSDGNTGQMKEPVILPSIDSLPYSERALRSGSHITGLFSELETGYPTTLPANIKAQIDSIHNKLETPEAKKGIIRTEKIYVDESDKFDKAEILVVAYGITARAAHEAVLNARRRTFPKVGLLRPITLWPSDEDTLSSVLSGGSIKKIIVAEQNSTGQYRWEIERLAGRLSNKLQIVAPEITGLNIYDSTRINENHILKEILK